MNGHKTLDVRLKKAREYTVADLFYTDWKQLSNKAHALVFSLQQNIDQLERGSLDYGINLISIMRPLRKNKLLVDKINVDQVVDCYNELRDQFLTKPWYNFPSCSGASNKKPEEYMAKCSFDQFIFADNEFTSYLATENVNYLKRLAATLYQQEFDKDNVDELSATKKTSTGELIIVNGIPPIQPPFKFKTHELELIFFTYMHVREFVVKRCRHLLPKAVSNSDSEKPKPSGPMWHEIKHSAARTLVFGTFEQLGKTNMYNVLDHLELLAKQPKEHAHA